MYFSIYSFCILLFAHSRQRILNLFHHLVSSDKGGKDVHLLLLTAVHLEIKQPLKDSCSWPAP